MSFMIMTHAVKPGTQGAELLDDGAETEASARVYRRPYNTLQRALHRLFPTFGKG